MRGVFLAIAVLFSLGAGAQGLNNVRINEVLVNNVENRIDEYGDRTSWIELHNAGYELVNIGGCFIGVTRADGSQTLYSIPTSDPATQMHQQTYTLFFCEGNDTKGTFYTNFTLEGVTKITLYNQGKSVIDEFVLGSAAQTPDVSVGWMGGKVIALPRTTPGATNETLATVAKDELFRQRDPNGGVMSVIAMLVVFFALVLIFFVLKGFGMAMMRLHSRPAPEVVVPKKKSAGAKVEEEMAAIGLALKLYGEEQHIAESTVITINRASRAYSPWSSKIHGLREMQVKK